MDTSRTSPSAAGVNADGSHGNVADSGAGSAAPFRRILLVGFMGSGKSTVGSLLASRVGWEFIDVDELVEEEDGRPIPRIFREDGEEGFRRIEHRIAGRLLGEDEVVLAPGGGWPCRPGRLEGAGKDTLSIWLRVSPERAWERVRSQGARRPLLEVSDPLRRIRGLIAEREPYYRNANWWVDTDLHLPPETVRRVTQHLEKEPERPLRV